MLQGRSWEHWGETWNNVNVSVYILGFVYMCVLHRVHRHLSWCSSTSLDLWCLLDKVGDHRQAQGDHWCPTVKRTPNCCSNYTRSWQWSSLWQQMRYLGMEDDVDEHRVYYYLKLAENLLLRWFEENCSAEFPRCSWRCWGFREWRLGWAWAVVVLAFPSSMLRTDREGLRGFRNDLQAHDWSVHPTSRRAQPRPHSHREGEGRWMKVTAMMEPRLNAKVLAQGRIQRSIEPGHASRSARSRIFAAEKKISEDAFHDTEKHGCAANNGWVAYKLAKNFADPEHAILPCCAIRKIRETREQALEITRLERFSDTYVTKLYRCRDDGDRAWHAEISACGMVTSLTTTFEGPCVQMTKWIKKTRQRCNDMTGKTIWKSTDRTERTVRSVTCGGWLTCL